MITYKLKINFQDPRVLTSDMEFVTGDVGAYRLECEFYDNGQPADLSGLLLSVKAKRADGAVFTDSGEISGGKGVYVLKSGMYAIAGELYLEIALCDSAQNYVTAKIITANVLQGLAEGNPAEDDVSVYVTLLSQMKAQIDAANALVDKAQISFDQQFAQLESELSQKADPGEPFEDLGLLDEESLWPVLDWLFEDGLYKYTEAGDGGTKTTYVFVNSNDTQGGGCRQTFVSSDGSIRYRICPYKEEVWRDFVPYVTEGDLEGALSEKADKETPEGGFVAGGGASAEDSAVAIGSAAAAKNGGGAVGTNAKTNAGGAVGLGAMAYNYGGAVGNGAIAGEGFSGGYNAKAATMEGYSQRYIDAIQLGTGTNQNEKTLQVYNYQLMDANGKIPAGRLPAGSGLAYKGEVNSFLDLPQSPSEGDVYQLKNGGIFCNSTYSDLLTGSFDEYFDDIYGDGSVYNFQNGIDNHPELSEYFTNPDSPLSYIYTSGGGYLCDTTYDQPGGYPKDFYAPIMTGEDTVAFYLSPVNTAVFYTVGDLGLVFYHDGMWRPVSDAGWIKSGYYTKEEVDGKVGAVDLWGGNVSDLSQLPSSPAPGTYCYAENDILNGVKYTGKVSDMFSIQEEAALMVHSLSFDPPSGCVQPAQEGDNCTGYVKIYTSDGTSFATMQVNPDTYPGSIDAHGLGAESLDDTVTFYLGIYDGEGFPDSIKTLYPADSMLFWNGTKWCRVPCAGAGE